MTDDKKTKGPASWTLRQFLMFRVQKLYEERRMFSNLANVERDPERQDAYVTAAFTAKAAADEIRDNVIPSLGQLVDVDLPITNDMVVHRPDEQVLEQIPAPWGPIDVKVGDAVVHLKMAEPDGEGTDAEESDDDAEAPEVHLGDPDQEGTKIH